MVKWIRGNGVCPYVDVGTTRFYIQDIKIWNGKYCYQLMSRDLSTETRKKLHPPKEIKHWFRKKWATEVFSRWFWSRYHTPPRIEHCYGLVSMSPLSANMAVFIDDDENTLQWRDLGLPITGRFDTERECIKEATDIISEKIREYENGVNAQIAFDGF